MDKHYIFISKGDVAQTIEYGVALTQRMRIDWYFATPLIFKYIILKLFKKKVSRWKKITNWFLEQINFSMHVYNITIALSKKMIIITVINLYNI